MKTATAVLACVSLFAAFTLGCNYVRPIMYVDIVNHSGHAMVNIEVKHPTGIFGLPELRNEQTHRHMAPLGAPCKFTISFEDDAGRKFSEKYDLGKKCPTEVAFDIGIGMSVTERLVRP